MKHIAIGDVSIYSEDEDEWDDLIKVVRKANKAYMESLNTSRQRGKLPWFGKIKKWAENKLFRC